MRELKQCKEKAVTHTFLRSKCWHFWIPRAIIAHAHPLNEYSPRSTKHPLLFFTFEFSRTSAANDDDDELQMNVNPACTTKHALAHTLGRNHSHQHVDAGGTNHRRRSIFTWATLKTVITSILKAYTEFEMEAPSCAFLPHRWPINAQCVRIKPSVSQLGKEFWIRISLFSSHFWLKYLMKS